MTTTDDRPMGRLPLEGITVIDRSTHIAGPFGTMMLADLGADVIKIERAPKGDPLRTVGYRHAGESVQCDNVNRNKRSVMLDLQTSNGRAQLDALIVSADVFVDSSRPGVADQIGFGDARLASLNERLIRVWLTGYGPTGPLAGQPAFDPMIQALTGIAHRQGRGGRPETVSTYLADKVGSLMLAQGVLAALRARDVRGTGESVELSLLDCLAYFNFPDVMDRRTYLDAALPSEPVQRSMIVQTKDGYIAVAPASGKQLRAALTVVGRLEELHGLRDAVDAADLMTRVLDLIETVTAAAPSSFWLDRFTEADVPAAPVLTLEQHLAHPQVLANVIYADATHPTKGAMRVVRYPVRFGSAPSVSVRSAAPQPGEHNDEVLGPTPT